MKRIVAKFGGSSVSSATQYKKVKEIILENPERNIIVVSAPGKDETHKSKVTDMLLLLYAHLEYDIQYDYLVDDIYNRYTSIIDELSLESNFENEFKEFKHELNKGISKDYLVSRGEYFNALIMSEYLQFDFLDSKDCIVLNYDGTVNFDSTKARLAKYIIDSKSYVITGFYASTPENQVRTFNRGGSDLTGSILAFSLNAKLYENWTDVSGLYVADPSIIDNPKRIDKITFNELRELSYRGANVLQQESLIPLEKTDISIHLKNTNRKDNFGTLISKDIEKSGEIITGMSGSTDFTSLTIVKDSLVSFSHVLKEVITIFMKYNINIEHIPTGIDTFSIITKTTLFKKVYFDLTNELRKVDGILDVSSEDEIALIAIVGRNMSFTPGIAGRIFSTLGKNKTNIKVIAQASKEISIIIGLRNIDYLDAFNILYKEFYTKK